jgi:hypothetical protein
MFGPIFDLFVSGPTFARGDLAHAAVSTQTSLWTVLVLILNMAPTPFAVSNSGMAARMDSCPHWLSSVIVPSLRHFLRLGSFADRPEERSPECSKGILAGLPPRFVPGADLLPEEAPIL